MIMNDGNNNINPSSPPLYTAYKRSIQGPDTEAQDLLPPDHRFRLATRGRSIQMGQRPKWRYRFSFRFNLTKTDQSVFRIDAARFPLFACTSFQEVHMSGRSDVGRSRL